MVVGPAVRGLPALDPAVPTVDGSCCAPGTPPPAATASDASDGGGDPEVRHPAESEAAGEARSKESEAARRGGDTIPQPILASNQGSVKMSKCRWTVRRYNLVAYGQTLYLVLATDCRSLILFHFDVERSVVISYF